MAYTKAGMKAVDRYVKENYARLNIKVPKSQEEAVKAHALRRGQSVNALVNELLRADMGLSEEAWKAKIVAQPMESSFAGDAIHEAPGMHEPAEASLGAGVLYETAEDIRNGFAGDSWRAPRSCGISSGGYIKNGAFGRRGAGVQNR